MGQTVRTDARDIKLDTVRVARYCTRRVFEFAKFPDKKRRRR